MSQAVRRVGLMGGSFNPIHMGHLFVAQEALSKFNLQRIIFVPAYRNPFKTDEYWKREMATPQQRLAMIELAISTNPDFFVSSFELDRNMPSYTLDTLKHFKGELGEESQLYFITGTDAVISMPHWNGIGEFHKYCEIIAATRPSFIPDYEAFLAKANELELKVYFITIPALEISSREIRSRARRGLPVRYLTPTAVAVYIEKHGIYRKE